MNTEHYINVLTNVDMGSINEFTDKFNKEF